MSNLAIISYLVIGVICAIGCRLLLRKSKIEVTKYWSVILGEGTEAILITVPLWPLTLLALVLYYFVQRFADRRDAKYRAANAERRRKEREDPLSTLTLDQLLQKVEEQKRKLGPES